MKRLILILLAPALLLGPGAAMADSSSHIALDAVAEIEVEVVNDQGEKEIRRVEAGRVVPGDEVIYTINYANVGTEPAEDVAITNPVPSHMVCKRWNEGAGDARITISIDGGRSYDAPENLKVVDAEGNERPARPADYTHIRWTLLRPVQPGTKGSVHFRARLL